MDFEVGTAKHGFEATGIAVGYIPAHQKRAASLRSVVELDGHSIPALQAAFAEAASVKGKPTALIAHTVKGKGVSFMENKMEWHYLPMTAEQYQMAVEEANRL